MPDNHMKVNLFGPKGIYNLSILLSHQICQSFSRSAFKMPGTLGFSLTLDITAEHFKEEWKGRLKINKPGRVSTLRVFTLSKFCSFMMQAFLARRGGGSFNHLKSKIAGKAEDSRLVHAKVQWLLCFVIFLTFFWLHLCQWIIFNIIFPHHTSGNSHQHCYQIPWCMACGLLHLNKLNGSVTRFR